MVREEHSVAGPIESAYPFMRRFARCPTASRLISASRTKHPCAAPKPPAERSDLEHSHHKVLVSVQGRAEIHPQGGRSGQQATRDSCSGPVVAIFCLCQSCEIVVDIAVPAHGVAKRRANLQIIQNHPDARVSVPGLHPRDNVQRPKLCLKPTISSQ
eukprot:4898682-Amphidinium_carterae.1